MKKIIVGLVLASCAAISGQAQTDHQWQKGKHHHRHEQMFSKLDLSSGQKDQLKTSNMDFRKQMQDLKKQGNITVKEWRSRREELMKAHRQQLESILTDSQKQQLKQLKEKRGEDHGGAFHQRSEKSMMQMKERLGLTDAQTSQLKDLHKDMSAKFEELRNNNSLTREEKKQQMMALRDQQQEKMKTILTEEQMKKMKEARESRHDKQSAR
jgi:Spy/CpxP family protein refolding chaperone